MEIIVLVIVICCLIGLIICSKREKEPKIYVPTKEKTKKEEIEYPTTPIIDVEESDKYKFPNEPPVSVTVKNADDEVKQIAVTKPKKEDKGGNPSPPTIHQVSKEEFWQRLYNPGDINKAKQVRGWAKEKRLKETLPQRITLSEARKYNPNVRSEWPLFILKNGKIDHWYYADIIDLDYWFIIEVDGGYHFEPDQIQKDRKRTEEIEELGLKVYRVSNKEVASHDMEDIVTKIYKNYGLCE